MTNERWVEKVSPSQATIIAKAPPKTWQELAEDCCSVFGGGYHTQEQLDIFRHGMRTAFNLCEGEMLSLPMCRGTSSPVPALVKAVRAAGPIVGSLPMVTEAMRAIAEANAALERAKGEQP